MEVVGVLALKVVEVAKLQTEECSGELDEF